MTVDIQYVRDQFPALASEAVYLDNPGGSQVATNAISHMKDYLVNTNANRGGAFATSHATDSIIERSRQALADFVNAQRPEEIVFGPNMTSLTIDMSRSLASRFSPSDEIIVTRLDHDANIAPWRQLAEAVGCHLHWIDFDPETGRLDLQALQNKLNERTKLVAVGHASNALGTVNPIAEITRMAHEVGAWVFIDAVQSAPHLPIDVSAINCDFLVASTYKLFGPHLGFLYGRYELLEDLPAYKVRPAPSTPPGKFETGTQNHEGIAGVLGTMEYLADFGQRFGGPYMADLGTEYEGQSLELKAAMHAIKDYEEPLSQYMLDQLAALEDVRLYGPATTDQRVPTFSFRLGQVAPRRVAELLGDLGIYVWDGNFYALAVTRHLGLEDQGGLVRVGLVHYNTRNEVDQLINGLKTIVAG